MKSLRRFLLAKFYATGAVLFTTLAHAQEATEATPSQMIFGM